MQYTALVSKSGKKKSYLFYLLSTLALLGSRTTFVQAQTTGSTITLSFLDANGDSAGATQSIPWAICQPLAVPGAYASASSSDPRAAINVYPNQYCQGPSGSTVGVLANTGYLANATAIRWEGTAHDDRATGSISPTVFPEKMQVQTQVPNPEDAVWEMDPAKGKLLVIVVAVVLALGVIVGVYQVYEAAQYVAPPKKEKKPTGLNVKKVKKADAFFKKPAMRTDDHQHAFQRLDTPEPGFYKNGAAGASARNSQYSDAATTFVDWSSQQQQQQQQQPSSQGVHSQQKAGPGSSNQFRGYDSVSIDMQHPQQQNNRYNNNNSNNNNSGTTTRSGSATPDLVQFEEMEDSRSRQRGRGGEVLVPMHTFDSNYHHPYQPNGRTPVRRPSSSRSR